MRFPLPGAWAALFLACVLSVPALSRPEENIPLPDWSAEKVVDHDLGHGIHMLESFGGNIGVVTGGDAILMVDAEWPQLHDKVAAAIARLSKQPVRYLINTHWHWDHTGGDGLFARDGAVIFSSPQTRLYIVQAQQQAGASPGAAVPGGAGAAEPYAKDPQAVPVVTVSDRLEFHVSGQTVQVMHVRPAHTDGDLLVRYVEADIIQTGDTFFHGFYPDIDQPHGGTIDGMIALYDQLYAMCGPNTRIIPGHGPMASRADVREYQGMLREVRARVAKALDAGMSEQALLASHPLDDLDVKWGGNLIKQPYLLAIVYEELAEARQRVNARQSAPLKQPP